MSHIRTSPSPCLAASGSVPSPKPYRSIYSSSSFVDLRRFAPTLSDEAKAPIHQASEHVDATSPSGGSLWRARLLSGHIQFQLPVGSVELEISILDAVGLVRAENV
jgi:hypothetical protein